MRRNPKTEKRCSSAATPRILSTWHWRWKGLSHNGLCFTNTYPGTHFSWETGEVPLCKSDCRVKLSWGVLVNQETQFYSIHSLPYYSSLGMVNSFAYFNSEEEKVVKGKTWFLLRNFPQPVTYCVGCSEQNSLPTAVLKAPSRIHPERENDTITKKSHSSKEKITASELTLDSVGRVRQSWGGRCSHSWCLKMTSQASMAKKTY